MKADKFDAALREWTMSNSGHEESRPYIGLSQISECPRKLMTIYRYGFKTPTGNRLMMHRLSFELEEVLKYRLTKMGIYKPGKEIQLHDGKIQGHTDGCIQDKLFELKTVELADYFPPDLRVPTRVYWQVQAYMRYTEATDALVVYFSRSCGLHKSYGVGINLNIGSMIEDKVSLLVDCIDRDRLPDCQCGRCK